MLSYALALKITKDAIRKRDALRAAEAAAFSSLVSDGRPADQGSDEFVTLRLNGGAGVRVHDGSLPARR